MYMFQLSTSYNLLTCFTTFKTERDFTVFAPQSMQQANEGCIIFVYLYFYPY